MLGNGDTVSRILVVDSPGGELSAPCYNCLNFETGLPIPMGMMLVALWTGLEGEEKVVISSENKPSVFHTAVCEHWMTFNSCFRDVDSCWSFWEAKCHSEIYGTRYCTDLSLLFRDLSVEPKGMGSLTQLVLSVLVEMDVALFLNLVVYLNQTFQPFRSKHLFILKRWWELT